MKSIRQIYYIALVSATSMLYTNTASAETLSGMFKRLTEQMASIAGFLIAVAFVAGIGLGVFSIIKLKEHSDNPNQTKLSKPLGYLVASAALIGIPSYLAIATNTLTGESHDSSDSSGDAYSKVK